MYWQRKALLVLRPWLKRTRSGRQFARCDDCGSAMFPMRIGDVAPSEVRSIGREQSWLEAASCAAEIVVQLDTSVAPAPVLDQERLE